MVPQMTYLINVLCALKKDVFSTTSSAVNVKLGQITGWNGLFP